MKIVILGGTGLIGSKVVNLLRARSHEVVGASPSKDIDSITGKGLTDALTEAQVVVHVTNAPSWKDKPCWNARCRRKKSVGHHVALSVAQEKLIKTSPIPYTNVRARQFFEFVGRIADEATNGQIVRLPSVLDSLPIQADKAASW